jgi:drug/metabolite transporter (DMT)-like permease
MGAPTSRSIHRQGVALCLTSAVAFGLMAIFAKEAYSAGLSVATLLSLRFALAATAFWAIVAVRARRAGPSGRTAPTPTTRTLLIGVGLGTVGYAGQSGLFFSALTRIDASLAALLLYLYPALVFLVALALGRERADRRRIGALALATGGAALVLLAGGTGDLDALGVAMAIGSALAYTAYILIADHLVGRIDAFLLCAVITSGAAVSITGFGLARGHLDLGFGAAGWGWIAALAIGCTVVAISTFLLGLPKVGPATASIVSTLEPVVTVAVAMVVLGERLTAVQALGGGLVLAAVVLLSLRGSKVKGGVPPADAPAPAPAGAPARVAARG